MRLFVSTEEILLVHRMPPETQREGACARARARARASERAREGGREGGFQYRHSMEEKTNSCLIRAAKLLVERMMPKICVGF